MPLIYNWPQGPDARGRKVTRILQTDGYFDRCFGAHWRMWTSVGEVGTSSLSKFQRTLGSK